MRAFEFPAWMAATALPPLPPAKVKPKQASIPSHRTQIAASTSRILKPDARLASTEISSLRLGASTYEVIRNFANASPDLSASVNGYIRLGIPERYTCLARNVDGSFNLNATQLAHEILRRYTVLGNPEYGSFSQQSVQSLSESLAKELLLYGALGGEIVLDKTRLPTALAAFSMSQVEFKDDDKAIPKSVKPVQVIAGVEIDLDLPTIIIVQLDQSLLTPYSSSYFESAIQPVIADSQFMEDLRRVLQRSVHPRLIASIVEDKVKKMMPPEVMNDSTLKTAYYETLISAVEDVVNGAEPEDAFITFDTVEYGFAEGGHVEVSQTLKAVQEVLNSKLATGAKTLPVVLGHTSSSNASSTESMLYLRNADVIRRKLNEFYSRALTVSVRLFGEDCYVEFRYDELNLRPEDELEAFRSMRTSRVLDLLSIGYYTDEEASILLTGNLPASGAPKLSGTMFRTPATAEPGNNPASNTSSGKSQGPQNRDPNSPGAPKGPAK
jgi:hypothetical protein